MRLFLVFFLFVACALPGSAARMKQAAQSGVHSATAQKESPESHGPVRNEDVQALRQDVMRMKALVQQMQSNLAFVDTTQSPLKHQFQLEIEMWQTLITEMDRRLDQASRRP